MQSGIKTILAAGFVAGTLDILSAFFVYTVLLQKTTPVKILQSIAGGVFKEQAFSSETTMPAYGLLFHFCIAYGFAVAYFVAYPLLPFLQKNAIISGIIYGVAVWAVMNLAVLPIVFAHAAPITLSSFSIAISILILMVGLPIALITHRHYTSLHRQQQG